MDNVKFMEMVNRVNLFLPSEKQIKVERFKANFDKGYYHIVLELSIHGKNLIIKDIYQPHSQYSETLYGLQKIFFTSVYDKILEIGLTNLIKQES